MDAKLSCQLCLTILFTINANLVYLSREFTIQSLSKRYGRLLNEKALEPGDAEAIVFLRGW